jgi:hypothetical protein
VRRVFILLLPLIALALSVPWPFVEATGRRLFGLPVWVIYSIAAAALFAITMAVLIGRYWEIAAGSEDDEDDDAR